MIKLHEIMKCKGVTQTALAKHLGVKQSTVSNWRTGRTPLPGSYVQEICDFLMVSPNALFGYEGLRRWNRDKNFKH